uniref:BPTI/Kunitz inhibitor domain-containing protein n=1 Tax=Strongyloides stercoralis TaxID=6248 RepID=A0A0K0EKC4_STRER
MLLQIFGFLTLAQLLIEGNSNCTEVRDLGYQCSDGVEEKRFYYHTKYKICSPFTYKGCGGNGNNFKSADECKETCSSVNKSNITMELAIKCNGTYSPNIKIDIQKCSPTSEDSCSSGFSCKNDICCPNKDYICSMEWDSGKEYNELKHIGRYAFKKEFGHCVRFSYFRNEGNLNNFLTYKDCMDFCK